MNEQEAIEQLQNEYLVSLTGRDAVASVRYHNEALDTAIAALKEVQEYHATGHTPKMVRELRRGYVDAHKTAVRYATQLDEYHDLGGFEACKAAVERTRWIPVSERMPVPEEEVLVTAVSRYGKTEVVPAIYEDGTMLENDSIWNWEELDGEWDEENECQIIPEAWWENRKYNPDCTYNCIIDDKVVAWMPLPEPYHITNPGKKEVEDE